jgi:hypothetical protein
MRQRAVFTIPHLAPPLTLSLSAFAKATADQENKTRPP